MQSSVVRARSSGSRRLQRCSPCTASDLPQSDRNDIWVRLCPRSANMRRCACSSSLKRSRKMSASRRRSMVCQEYRAGEPWPFGLISDGPLPELLRREPRQFNSPPAGHQMDCSGAEFKIGCHAQYSHETGIAPNLILFVFAIAIIQYLIIQAQSQIRKDGDACDAGERSFVGYLHAWYGPFHGERARRIEGEVAMCGKNRINASSCGTSRKASPVTRT